MIGKVAKNGGKNKMGDKILFRRRADKFFLRETQSTLFVFALAFGQLHSNNSEFSIVE